MYSENKHYVFVYGSLKLGFERNCVFNENNSSYIGVAITKQSVYTMYSFGSFPCVTCGDKQILGEVYHVNDFCLKQLDQIESHPQFYMRQQHYFNLYKDGQKIINDSILSWIYLIQDVSNYDLNKRRVFTFKNTCSWMFS